jgi:hypothetical protein
MKEAVVEVISPVAPRRIVKVVPRTKKSDEAGTEPSVPAPKMNPFAVVNFASSAALVPSAFQFGSSSSSAPSLFSFGGNKVNEGSAELDQLVNTVPVPDPVSVDTTIDTKEIDVMTLDVAPEEQPDNQHRQRLVELFTKFNPAKLREVDSLLHKYSGREAVLFKKIDDKYCQGTPLVEPLELMKEAVVEVISPVAPQRIVKVVPRTKKSDEAGTEPSVPAPKVNPFAAVNFASSAALVPSAFQFGSSSSSAPSLFSFGGNKVNEGSAELDQPVNTVPVPVPVDTVIDTKEIDVLTLDVAPEEQPDNSHRQRLCGLH